MQDDSSYARFPLWLELSGLPAHLNTAGKVPYAWAVFHKLVELDCARHALRPGTVEVAPAELATLCGLDADKIAKAVKAMRKAGIVRAFLPDNADEAGLFEVITPVPTPLPCEEVRRLHPEAFLDGEWPPRYAESVQDSENRAEDASSRVRQVAELYMNTFSMKMNAIILDQLRLIATRYSYELVEKVFQQALKREARTLSWILTEIRREEKVRAEADALRQKHGA